MKIQKNALFSWAGNNKDLQFLLNAKHNAGRNQFKPLEWRHAIALIILTIIILSL